MRCPHYKICVTPQLYGEKEKKRYVEVVCTTNEHKRCTHFLYGMFPEKDSEEYRRIIRWLLAKKRELKEKGKAMWSECKSR